MDYKVILPKVLAKLFPDPDVRAEAEAILSQYGTEKYHREVPRVRTAILRVAGDNLEEIRQCTEYACRDYRDALCAAEYPNQAQYRWHFFLENPDEHEKLIQEDLKQHQEWIDSIVDD